MNRRRLASSIILAAVAACPALAEPAATVSGSLHFAIDVHDVEAQCFLDGKPLSAADGELRLGDGLNIIAIQAVATGARPRLGVELRSRGRQLRVHWLWRVNEPDADWRSVLRVRGWQRRVSEGKNLWPQGAQQAYFTGGVYAPEPSPPFFPRLSTYFFPRGSRQLMRLYIPAPDEAPLDGHRMVVEVPAALRPAAVEPIGGGHPQLSRVGAFNAAGKALSRYHIRYDYIPRQGIELSLRWGDEAGRLLAYQPAIAVAGTFDWRHLQAEVTAPAGAANVRALLIKWQNRGITGTLWADNVALHEKNSTRNLLTMGSFDEPEYGNQPMLQLEGADGSRCFKLVALPSSADRQQAFWIDRDRTTPVIAGKTYVVELDVRGDRIVAPHGKPLCGLLFEAPPQMAEGDYPAFTYFESLDGAIVGLPQPGTVVVLPPLKNVRPRWARITPCYYGSQFRNPEVARAFADNCLASGITWTYGRANNDIVPHLLPHGHRVILSLGWSPWSALPDQRELLEAHSERQAVDFRGRRMKTTFCPTWLLSQGESEMAILRRWVQDAARSGPYAGVDWDLEQPVVDPPTFCTCRRCRNAFREFAHLPLDQTVEPEDLLSRHRKAWTDFRCTQNAAIAGRLKSMVADLRPPIEFSLYSGYQSARTREHYGVDWAKMAPHLDFAIAGYGGNREALRATIDALGDVPFMGGEMWYLSPTDDARPPPRMKTWRNRLLRQYFDSGCRGCLIWQLSSMDGGAFYATSEAAAIIAEFEDFFLSSQRCDDGVVVSGVPATDWAAFRHGGRIIVVLMNFEGEPRQATLRMAERTRTVVVEAWGTRVVKAAG